MKSVLIITTEFPPILGGAGNYIKLFAEAATKCANVTLIAPTGSALNHSTYTSLFFKCSLKMSLIFLILKIKIALRCNYDQIYLNDPASVLAAIILKLDPNKCTVICHGQETEEIFLFPRTLYKFINFKHHYKSFIEKANLIFVSQDLMAKFKENKAIDTNKRGAVLYPTASKHTRNIDNQRDFQITQTRNNFIFTASRLIKHKGYAEMLEVVLPILKENANLEWLIAGDGEYREEFERLCEQTNHKHQIRFLGQLTSAELGNYYSKARVFMLLSNYRESFGLVYLEAISHNCKVLANDFGGIREIGSPLLNFVNLKDCTLVKTNILRSLISDTTPDISAEAYLPRDFTTDGFSENVLQLILHSH